MLSSTHKRSGTCTQSMQSHMHRVTFVQKADSSHEGTSDSVMQS